MISHSWRIGHRPLLDVGCQMNEAKPRIIGDGRMLYPGRLAGGVSGQKQKAEGAAADVGGGVVEMLSAGWLHGQPCPKRFSSEEIRR